MKKLYAGDCMIGNVALLANKQPFTLNAIEIQAMVNEGYVYHPMKITVKILELLGFKNDGSDNMSIPLPNGNSSELHIEYEMGSTCLVREWGRERKTRYPDEVNQWDFVYIKHLQYVHEVQNLYQLLCGKELDIFNLLSKYK